LSGKIFKEMINCTNMLELKEKKCVPCDEGTPPLNREEIKGYMDQLQAGWEVMRDKTLRKHFPFENFRRGMAFAQKIALLAEQENHHPDLCIHYTGVDVELSTHVIGGLSVNDFIMAAKIEHI